MKIQDKFFIIMAVIVISLLAVVTSCGPDIEAQKRDMEYRSKGGDRINDAEKDVAPLYDEMK